MAFYRRIIINSYNFNRFYVFSEIFYFKNNWKKSEKSKNDQIQSLKLGDEFLFKNV